MKPTVPAECDILCFDLVYHGFIQLQIESLTSRNIVHIDGFDTPSGIEKCTFIIPFVTLVFLTNLVELDYFGDP